MDKKFNLCLQGKSLSSGIAIGTAYIYCDLLEKNHEYYEITTEGVNLEFNRIEKAINNVIHDLKKLQIAIEDQLDENMANIFLAQEMILSDQTLLNELRQELEAQLINSEQIIKIVFRRFEKKMLQSDNSIMQERGSDFLDLATRIIRKLKGIKEHALENIPEGTVLCAQELLPSDTVFMPRNKIKGVILEHGGIASHAAILTREMGVPSISGVPYITKKICNGDSLIVDAFSGKVIVNPSEDIISEYLEKKEVLKHQREKAVEKCQYPAITSTGTTINVYANIGSISDALIASENGADGIGLLRMETFFMQQQNLPLKEELQGSLFNAFAPLKGEIISIRLLDIGADKNLPYLDFPEENNPMLGRRGIRLLLDYPDLLSLQLQVLVNLSVNYDIRIIVPMVTLAEEMRSVRSVLNDICSTSKITNIPKLGAMIETPAAVLCIEDILEDSDFISLGTNDLTQYTMAAGRENSYVDKYYDIMHPAVIKLIEQTITAARKDNIPTEICGEIASVQEAIPTLIKAGILNLSVSPLQIPFIKEYIRSL